MAGIVVEVETEAGTGIEAGVEIEVEVGTGIEVGTEPEADAGTEAPNEVESVVGLGIGTEAGDYWKIGQERISDCWVQL